MDSPNRDEFRSTLALAANVRTAADVEHMLARSDADAPEVAAEIDSLRAAIVAAWDAGGAALGELLGRLAAVAAKRGGIGRVFAEAVVTAAMLRVMGPGLPSQPQTPMELSNVVALFNARIDMEKAGLRELIPHFADISKGSLSPDDTPALCRLACGLVTLILTRDALAEALYALGITEAEAGESE